MLVIVATTSSANNRYRAIKIVIVPFATVCGGTRDLALKLNVYVRVRSVASFHTPVALFPGR
jgi:hypothetical protein